MTKKKDDDHKRCPDCSDFLVDIIHYGAADDFRLQHIDLYSPEERCYLRTGSSIHEPV